MKTTPSQIGFLLFLLANATIYVRPWEIFPQIAEFQIYLFLILAAFLFSYKQIQHHLKLPNLYAQPITFCVIGIFIAIPLSHMSNGYLGGVTRGTYMFFKTIMYFLVLVAVIDSTRRFRVFIISLAVCGLICIAVSVADYHGVIPIESLTHIKEREGYTAAGKSIYLIRLCGLGMFHDPNDMSLLIITTGFLCLSQMFDREWGKARFLWAAAFPLLFLAIADTHSRGGLIAAGAGTMAYLSMRYGRAFALTAIGMGVLAAPLALGRMANIDLSGGTGQQRIRLWSEGFQAIQGPKVFFGIGEGTYEALANYVAHNSYVHAFVELGLFGGTMFVGCFFFSAYGLYRMKRDNLVLQDQRLQHFQPFVAAILATWCAGFLSLSRCYPPPTFTIVGIATVYLNLAGVNILPMQPVNYLDKPAVQRWFAGSALVFVSMFVATKLLARF